jgi:predicted DNA-binding transcriptional regulator AlpA
MKYKCKFHIFALVFNIYYIYLTLAVMNEENMKNDIISIDEVCRLTGYKPASIYVFNTQKRIPVIKPKGTKMLMFSRAAILEWMQSDREPIK